MIRRWERGEGASTPAVGNARPARPVERGRASGPASEVPVAQPSFQSDEVTLRSRNPWAVAAAVLVGLAAPALLAALAVARHHPALLWLAPLSALGGLLLHGANIAPRERLGRLVVNELGVF